MTYISAQGQSGPVDASAGKNSACGKMAESEGRIGKVNGMSIDVEDYFQVSAMAPYVARKRWGEMESRVRRNVDKALDMFASNEVKATFFVLGWVGERFPSMVREIADLGHEIASHGYEHVKVHEQRPDEFRQDVSRTKLLLEDLSGQSVIGYRAASFSFTQATPWAHEVLAETGHKYSSSVYPVRHDHYGMPGAPRQPHIFRDTGLLEIPLTTLRFAGRNWPIAGGGYFRALPLQLFLWALNKMLIDDPWPAVFYFHPWELDPEQPRLREASLKAKFRHYINLEKFESRLATILAQYSWQRIDSVFLQKAGYASGPAAAI